MFVNSAWKRCHVQKGAPAPTLSTRSTAPPSRALFNENTANVTASKTYITSQQLMNRTRNNPKRRKVTTS